MPNFAGQWQTTRYTGNDPENPEAIVLSITVDATENYLDGAYARPGQDARLYGAIEGNGSMWRASIDEISSSGDQGNVVFFISDDGNTLHGAWVSSQHSNGPQPWFGTRI